MLKRQHQTQKFRAEDDVLRKYPVNIAKYERVVNLIESDKKHYEANKNASFRIEINGKTFVDRTEAGAEILTMKKLGHTNGELLKIGIFKGFDISLQYSKLLNVQQLVVHKFHNYTTDLSGSEHGNVIRIENILDKIDDKLITARNSLENEQNQLKSAELESKKPFASEKVLADKLARLNELNNLLNLEKSEVSQDKSVESKDNLTEVEDKRTSPSIQSRIESAKARIINKKIITPNQSSTLDR